MVWGTSGRPVLMTLTVIPGAYGDEEVDAAVRNVSDKPTPPPSDQDAFAARGSQFGRVLGRILDGCGDLVARQQRGYLWISSGIRHGGLTLWVPKMPSLHATCEYSWRRPPSLSRRRTRMLSSGRDDGEPAVGWSLAEGPVWPVAVVVIDILAEDVMEVPSAGDEDAVGALAPSAGDPPLADRIRTRRLDRRCDDPYVGRGEDRVERVGVLGIPVSDQELQAVGPLTGVHEDVPGLLDRPGGGGMGGDAGQVDAATVVLDDEQHVEPAEEDGVDVEKSTAATVLAWADRNCFQCWLRVAGRGRFRLP